jgi:formyl-CoA transferase
MDYWIEQCQQAGIPVGAIHDFPQVFNDPHLAARGFFSDAPHETIGTVRQIGSPMHLSRTPTRMDSAGPLLGQHSREVLLEIGCSESEIARLTEEGVVTVR